ncbi:uncharacterized protein Dana_GF13899 [Drosophila ananassae]|uniref:Metalloendopeptidase n=1 Tax=Drosophila ananassae TaxID=7217 RepID=B3N1B8_DROAN|nr:seminal metalloprotease 1 [Drosophila ananassae]EDV33639.1 uncharacterized protein Dana_GF13899 [Drosophila ananassae]
MSKVGIVTFLLMQVLISWGKPLPAGVYDPEEAGGFVQGDMMLTPDQKNNLAFGPKARNGVINPEKRWPQNLVVYRISDDFDNSHKKAIETAIETLKQNTCIKFREATDADTAYLTVTANPGGCYTAVGYRGAPQEMNLEVYPLGEGCFRPGTILHEFMHALGFYHQQSSAIRDGFVNVVYDNIVPGKEFNFEKYSDSVVTDFDLGYDYDSCLHYRPGAFSINGEDTIVPLDSSAQIGQRLGLSSKDIDKINIMYKCPILV